MRLAICTLPGSPEDVHVWSGTPAHFMQALRRRGEEPIPIGPLGHRAYRAANLLSNVTGRLGAKVNWEAEPAALEFFTRSMRRQLRVTRADAVLLMGWYPLGLRQSDPPCIYWGDATVGQRLGLAPHWSGLSTRTNRMASDTEAMSLQQVAGVFMPSAWARQDAILRYSLDPARVFRVPFGSNLEDPGITPRHRPSQPLRLLTVGVKWYRKGFDRAVETVDILNAGGTHARLDVVGAMPPDASWSRPYVTYHGFLSKERHDEGERLRALYREADLFLLPTRNDPFPMVLGEAAAYALPVVAASVGGVPDRVDEGGVLLPETATPTQYAEAVLSAAQEPMYRRLSEGARRDYMTRSSWDASAGLALSHVQRLLESA